MATGLRGHVQEVRELIHELRPLTLDQLDLAKAVEQQVSQFDQQTGIKASFTISGDVALNSFAEVTVFRVAQECLTNVQKHANATQVDVRIQVTDTGLEAMVKDNGKGFAAREVASDAAGKSMGLLRMRERSELLGGSLSVHSSPDRRIRNNPIYPDNGGASWSQLESFWRMILLFSERGSGHCWSRWETLRWSARRPMARKSYPMLKSWSQT